MTPSQIAAHLTDREAGALALQALKLLDSAIDNPTQPPNLAALIHCARPIVQRIEEGQ